jgi:cytoskeletal protein RodZ
MLMGSLGETLRQARLNRGASLADAERETRIRRKYLEALEAEDYGALPATVYTRGFIRTYARYLGLDPESTLDLLSPARGRVDGAIIRPATPQVTSTRPVSMRIFVGAAGVLLLGLLLAYLWTQYNSFVESLGEAGGTTAQRTVVNPTPPRPLAVVSPSPVPGASPVASPVAAAPVVTPTVRAEPTPTPESGVTVEARVTDRTWMEVWVDGSSQLQAALQAGSVRSFSGRQSVRMRVGNAGGVEVTVNGEGQGPLGERHQVKEFVWER